MVASTRQSKVPKSAPKKATRQTKKKLTPRNKRTLEDSSDDDDSPLICLKSSTKRSRPSSVVVEPAKAKARRRKIDPDSDSEDDVLQTAECKMCGVLMTVDLLDRHGCAGVREKRVKTPEEEMSTAPASKRFKTPEASVLNLSLEELARIMKERKQAANPDIRCPDCGIAFPKEFHDDHHCRKPELKMAVVEKKPVDEMDQGELLSRASNLMTNMQYQSEHLSKYVDAKKWGSRHESRRANALKALTDIVARNKEQLGPLAELIEHKPGELYPTIFTAIGGAKSKTKILLASDLLWLYVVGLTNTKTTPGDCPYLQPNSEDTYLRSMLSVLKDEFDWRFSVADDFNFPGGLAGKITQLRQERAEEFPNTYGTASKKQIPTATHVSEVDLMKLDEHDIHQHQQKCLITCGLYLAFRGAEEHSKLLISQIEFGHFEKGHPLEGQEYIRVNKLQDKTHQLSMTNSVKRDTKNMMRLPVDRDNLVCPGGVIARLVGKAGPGQVRVYCQAAKPKELVRFRHMGFLKARMSPKKPIGVNTLRPMIREANQVCGVGDVSGHGCRRLAITSVVNAPNVNMSESLAFARHRTPSTQAGYIQRNHVSELHRFEAQGIPMNRSVELQEAPQLKSPPEPIGQLKSPPENGTPPPSSI